MLRTSLARVLGALWCVVVTAQCLGQTTRASKSTESDVSRPSRRLQEKCRPLFSSVNFIRDLGRGLPWSENAAKFAAVRDEIQRLGDGHAWAGEYTDGMGRRLAVAPDNGLAFEFRGPLSLSVVNHGDVSIDNDGVIHVDLQFANEAWGILVVPSTFVPVRWGDRRYLIPVEDIGSFCNAASSAFGEPRDTAYGRYLLRVGDHEKSVAGQPTLPMAYRKYLVSKPIRATITSVTESKVDDSNPNSSYCQKTRVQIDAGTADGLVVGLVMRVNVSEHVTELEQLLKTPPLELKITKCDEKSAEGEIVQSLIGCGSVFRAPEFGWRVDAGVRSEK